MFWLAVNIWCYYLPSRPLTGKMWPPGCWVRSDLPPEAPVTGTGGFGSAGQFAREWQCCPVGLTSEHWAVCRLGALLLKECLRELRSLWRGLCGQDYIWARLPEERYILTSWYWDLLHPQSLIGVIWQGMWSRKLLLLLEDFGLDGTPLRRFGLYWRWHSLDDDVLHNLALRLGLRSNSCTQRHYRNPQCHLQRPLWLRCCWYLCCLSRQPAHLRQGTLEWPCPLELKVLPLNSNRTLQASLRSSACCHQARVDQLVATHSFRQDLLPRWIYSHIQWVGPHLNLSNAQRSRLTAICKAWRLEIGWMVTFPRPTCCMKWLDVDSFVHDLGLKRQAWMCQDWAKHVWGGIRGCSRGALVWKKSELHLQCPPQTSQHQQGLDHLRKASQPKLTEGRAQHLPLEGSAQWC